MSAEIVGMRDDTWAWTVIIDGINYGIFDAKEGGEVDSDDSTFRPGNMGEQYSLGGPTLTGNVTMRRQYRLHRDHPTSQKLIQSAGKARAKLIGQPLDHDSNAWGTPFVYVAKLKKVLFPTHDSTSASPSMLELEFTVDGKPTGM